MNNNLRHLIVLGAAAAYVAAWTASAMAGGGGFTRGCAARDLQVMMMIEQQEGSNSIAPEKISEALTSMMNARMVCHEGYVMDALAIYDEIIANLAAPPVMFGAVPREVR
jgi:hypothetical protein